MNERKSLLRKLIETIDEHRAEQRTLAPELRQQQRRRKLSRIAVWFLPNGGTLLMMVLLIATQSIWSHPLRSPSATFINTISYQGRLADTAGNPLTDLYNMEFRIYDVPDGGTPLWQEYWTGGNSVNVSDGLFNVMLGSLDNTLASAIAGHDELYLGITVGTDSEMSPRVPLGSVPFSFQAQEALTVSDDSITSAKIADGAVGSDKMASGSVTTEKIANGAVTLSKLGEQPYYFHGALATPSEWMADVIYNGNYARFCEEIGRSYIRADELQAHSHIERGNGFFYSGWYYAGSRYHESDTHVSGDGNPDSNYNMWIYNDGGGCCITGHGWTFERSAVIWCDNNDAP